MPRKIIAPFQPLSWQLKPWRDKSYTVLLTGSAGGGKSRLAAEKIHAYCLKYPGATGLMARKTRESMTNSTVLFFERRIVGGDKTVRHLQSKHRFEYANGSVLVYGGMKNEEQREQIRSIGQDGSLDIAWLEEANKFSETDFNEVIPRIRGNAAPWRQILLSTNPDSPYHWIYKRLIVGGEASTYYSGAVDNPHNAPDYLDQLEKVTGVLGQRLREGNWVQAEGVIYGGYSEELHLVARFDIPKSWDRFRVVDFGYEHPFVCQWWAQDPDGRLYRYREIYMTHRTVATHAAQINKLSRGEAIEFTVADHDAEDRATLHEHGIDTLPAIKDVSTGIQAVMQRLQVAGDGKPRLFFLKDSLVEVDQRLIDAHLPTCTEEEITLYSWKPRKDEPVKEYDHGMDCVRYVVKQFDRFDVPRVRTV